jgi:hypothetical protein
MLAIRLEIFGEEIDALKGNFSPQKTLFIPMVSLVKF